MDDINAQILPPMPLTDTCGKVLCMMLYVADDAMS